MKYATPPLHPHESHVFLLMFYFCLPTLWSHLEKNRGGGGNGGYGYRGVRGLNQIQMHFSLSVPSSLFLQILASVSLPLSYIFCATITCHAFTCQSLQLAIFFPFNSNKIMSHIYTFSSRLMASLIQIQTNLHEIMCSQQADVSSVPLTQTWHDLCIWSWGRHHRVLC